MALEERKNLVLHAMQVAILERFQNVARLCDDGLIERLTLDKPYEEKLKKIEEQFGRISVGLGRLDSAETKDDYASIARKIKQIAGTDLSNAIVEFLDAYLKAVYRSCEGSLK